MGKKNRRRSAPEASKEPLNNPFSSLSSKDFADVKEEQKKEKVESLPHKYPNLNKIKLNIRIQKKGRGGKTVTVLEGFPLSADDEIMVLCQDLQKSLGTGGTVYEDRLEVQGDLRLRIAAFLEKEKLKFGGEIK